MHSTATLQPLPLGHIRLLAHCTKARAQAGRAANDDFQLCIPVHHRMGPHTVEPWLLIWRGPAAQAFWQQHGTDGLASGTPLLVQAHHLRAHASGRAPEITAHVFSCEIAPARSADKREQLSEQEQTA